MQKKPVFLFFVLMLLFAMVACSVGQKKADPQELEFLFWRDDGSLRAERVKYQYSGLTPGIEYRMTVEILDEYRVAMKDSDGTPLMADQLFTPRAASGEVDLVILLQQSISVWPDNPIQTRVHLMPLEALQDEDPVEK